MSAIELRLAAPAADQGTVDRREADHLLRHQHAFTAAFHAARALGREMLWQLEEMDAARRELEKQGIYTSVEFQPELQAAYRSLRRLLNTGELDVPDFLRRA